MDDVEFVRELYDASYRRLLGQLLAVTADPAEAEALAVWQLCRRDHCREVWRLNVETVARHRHANMDTTTLRSVTGGSVLAGDVTVRTGKGWMVVDPSTATEWPVDTGRPGEHADFAAISGATLWVEGVRDVGGRHVAAIATPNGADATVPDHYTVSNDAGRTWTQVPAAALPFATIESWAATNGGTLYVADMDQRLWRSTDDSWTHFERAPGPVVDLQASGRQALGRYPDSDRVIAQLGDSGHPAPLQVR
ncbi:MAG: hypothetical protein ACRDPB_02270 [Nocardioidaceae bacterium]